MAVRRKWLWIIGGLFAAVIVVLSVAAGAGIYFVTKNISTRESTGPEAAKAFDEARKTFAAQQPLVELDAMERPRTTRDLSALPTGKAPEHLWVLAWNPREQRIVKVSIPFWLLRMGPRSLDMQGGNGSFNLERLNLDMQQLERVGPQLVADFSVSSGERILIWTK